MMEKQKLCFMGANTDAANDRIISSHTVTALALATAFGLTVTQPALAEIKEYVVVSARINPVMYPENVENKFKECINDPVCVELIKQGASYLGVPTILVTAATGFVSGGKPDISEEGHYTITLPPDYTYCHSKVDVASVVPADGPRGSILSVTSTPVGVGVYTWTPKRGLGQGRSWVDANLTVYGVLKTKAEENLATSKCVTPGQNFLNCRGNGSGDRNGCSSVSN